MTDIHTTTFRGHEFKFRRGTVHPQYSIDCFLADESPFREKYWDIKPGDVVVDAGASYGAYALTAAACGATVFAFEPEPTVFVDLLANSHLNGANPIHALCLGLWDTEEGTEEGDRRGVDMYSYAPHWPPGTISRPFRMTTLDTALGPVLMRLDWLKLDIEGAEERALRGALETIRKFKPNIIVECHVFLDAELTNKCRALIESCGAYRFEVVPREPCEMLVCVPEGRT